MNEQMNELNFQIQVSKTFSMHAHKGKSLKKMVTQSQEMESLVGR